MNVIVDTDLCAGHAQCADVAPEVFDIGTDGKVQLLVPSPPESMRPRIEEAVRLCPVDAIALAD